VQHGCGRAQVHCSVWPPGGVGCDAYLAMIHAVNVQATAHLPEEPR
jgi:hypothetical protein